MVFLTQCLVNKTFDCCGRTCFGDAVPASEQDVTEDFVANSIWES